MTNYYEKYHGRSPLLGRRIIPSSFNFIREDPIAEGTQSLIRTRVVIYLIVVILSGYLRSGNKMKRYRGSDNWKRTKKEETKDRFRKRVDLPHIRKARYTSYNLQML
jgi:hypothetical protein